MSKRSNAKRNGAATLDPAAMAKSTAAKDATEKAGESTKRQEKASEPDRTVSLVDIPAHTCQSGNATRRIDCTCTPRQAAAAKVLWSSLTDTGARFPGGRNPSNKLGSTVENINDGVRWMLEQYALQLESQGVDLLNDFHLDIS